MKKVFLGLAILLASVSFSYAQVNPHALGLRFGGGTALGGEISYQHGLGSANRLEFDLGFNGDKDWSVIGLTGMYHWDWNLTGGLNWFVGPGVGLGIYSFNNSNKLNLGVGGQIGLEYDFKTAGVPLLLSLDARPMWNFTGYDGFGWGASLGLRYVW